MGKGKLLMVSGSWNVNERQLSVIMERGGGCQCVEREGWVSQQKLSVGCGGERRNGCHARLSEALMAKQREKKLTVTVVGQVMGSHSARWCRMSQ